MLQNKESESPPKSVKIRASMITNYILLKDRVTSLVAISSGIRQPSHIR